MVSDNGDIRRRWRDSDVARRVCLPAHVVIARPRVSPERVVRLARGDEELEVRPEERTCELVVGGQAIASGRIVIRRGKAYLRIERQPAARRGTEEV